MHFVPHNVYFIKNLKIKAIYIRHFVHLFLKVRVKKRTIGEDGERKRQSDRNTFRQTISDLQKRFPFNMGRLLEECFSSLDTLKIYTHFRCSPR